MRLKKVISNFSVCFIVAVSAPAFGQGPAMLQATLGAGNACEELAASWTPQYSGLVAYWKHNGLLGSIANGTTIPDAHGSYNGVASNADGAGMSYVNGILDQAISFDGVDDHVTISTSAPAALNLTTLSISMWIKSTTANPSGTSLISTGTQNNNKGFLIQWLFGYIYVQRMISGSNEQIRSSSGTLLPANTWTHLVVVISGTSVTIYINGSAIATTGSWTGSVNSYLGSNFFIGMRADGYQLWKGNIDDVGVWNVALGASDVSTLYNHQKCGH